MQLKWCGCLFLCQVVEYIFRKEKLSKEMNKKTSALRNMKIYVWLWMYASWTDQSDSCKITQSYTWISSGTEAWNLKGYIQIRTSAAVETPGPVQWCEGLMATRKPCRTTQADIVGDGSLKTHSWDFPLYLGFSITSRANIKLTPDKILKELFIWSNDYL